MSDFPRHITFRLSGEFKVIEARGLVLPTRPYGVRGGNLSPAHSSFDLRASMRADCCAVIVERRWSAWPFEFARQVRWFASQSRWLARINITRPCQIGTCVPADAKIFDLGLLLIIQFESRRLDDWWILDMFSYTLSNCVCVCVCNEHEQLWSAIKNRSPAKYATFVVLEFENMAEATNAGVCLKCIRRGCSELLRRKWNR